jgi:hypothetical protein
VVQQRSGPVTSHAYVRDGHAASISAGEWLTASGEWVNDRTHGQQFKARFVRTSPPTSTDERRKKEPNIALDIEEQVMALVHVTCIEQAFRATSFTEIISLHHCCRASRFTASSTL